MPNGVIVPTDYKYGFSKPESYVFKAKKGLSKSVVEQISSMKNEPGWMREQRLKALEIFFSKKMPKWVADLYAINFDDIYYYIKPIDRQAKSWDELPKEIRETYDAIGIPEAEKKFLAGVTAQYESEAIYHSFKKQWEDKGVIFLDFDSGLRQYPELVKQYFGRAVPAADNKFAALNSAVWSGGSFIYVPKGVSVDIPLQAYFRINAANMGQFERTLIIVDEGAYVSYIEGCSAPVYTVDSLHAAVVEIFVKKGARCRYTTIQNWSSNVYNLVTKRAFVEEEGTMEWVDGNIGSRTSMKYPSCYLVGQRARGEILSLSMAGYGQHQDVGGKLMFLAPDTSGEIISKSVSHSSGRTSYRGLVKVIKGAERVKCNVRCDALILDEKSRSDTYPTMQVGEDNVRISHEASVSKIDADQLFYLMSRGLSEIEATSLIVNGFIEPVVRELPLEYAVELNRLIQLNMEDAIG
ncbi:Fe-S cluster assembly protein SufB [Candidatus Curtissbacteria bacterium RIFCSPHIGHO2_01_FULL_41_44]|uniref:Fe-S cluster assembly protein SufB n=1 Tax=Candidatus Curtissbacteria bacterium RIFCSPLOWO2_01_FULL_42_50 TaxID=1797730 RepID=A0A1F5H7T3_9BACT|nr:MAG: Fe-S cluster assembly protein SufB [Candidatus Curtissbacteria bacterium RIFCSPHIGHO2_02_FULL_42_58]OGD94708.1 MAG: Fe-S cluster assembly protein SufB [Candidatus Curtissbacteria bacterium RIFCSPHIGHO2_01_FULL_41_44]OGD97015.1 MAG: Fe-S cluster assembly protein SufB [Candidatus Curtissbacteria bacterium RIFCSPHIGHO2_12_FULL_42_33]OGE00223.1 MAG: Fe-S cluster assembly protein SufB [Candidatus Curtissbacteria bacterium RIFCSPLOWO2_01_FULL_42_50]OGE10012.1 MAG: Fe-S cluster assembly protei